MEKRIGADETPSDKDPKKLVPVTETSKDTTLALAAAHALVLLDDGTVVGDPMEKTTLAALDWKLSKGASVLSENQLCLLDILMRLVNRAYS